MKCPMCDGRRTLFTRDQPNVVTQFGEIKLVVCPTCNGTGEVEEKKQTNFQRITASPGKLAEFIYEVESVYERCAKGDLNCDYCECQWCGLAGRKDLIDWLNEESKE